MYDRQSIYVTFGGSLATTEEWTTGLHYAHPEHGAGDHNVTTAEWAALVNTATLMTDLETLLTTWFKSGDGGSGIGGLATLSWVKLAWLDLDGHYLSDPPLVREFAPQLPPVATPHPPQVSYVISLRSAGTLGDANYGRMYCPPPFWLVGQSNGLASTSQATSARVAAKTMINGITAKLNGPVPGLAPVIMSKKGIGTTKQVMRLGVGRVLDTQRRRRRSLDEDLTLENL